MEAVEAATSGLLQKLKGSGESTALLTLPDGGALAVSKLGSLLASNDSSGDDGLTEVALPPELDMTISLPAALRNTLAALGEDVVMTVAALPLPNKSSTGDGGDGGGDDIRSMAIIELGKLDGGKLNVSGLQQAIRFGLPVNYSLGLGCFFFDEDTGSWSNKGMGLAGVTEAGGRLFCETTHLSIFGAIFRGIVTTLSCANFGLFNSEAVARISQGRWYAGRGAAVAWALLSLAALAMAAAAWLDRKYAGCWDVDLFLLAPTQREDLQRGGSCQSGFGSQSGSQQSLPSAEQEEAATKKKAGACGCLAALGGGLGALGAWLRSSTALREAVDDIISNWLSWFAEVREILETLYEALDLHSAMANRTGRFAALLRSTMAHSVVLNSRHSANFSMFLSDETAAFVSGDEELKAFLVEQQEMEASKHSLSLARGLEPEENIFEEAARSESRWWDVASRQGLDFERRQQRVWVLLHYEVTQQMDAHTKDYAQRSVCRNMLSLLVHHNPVAAALPFSIVQSCKVRVLVMLADALGAVAISCAFFQAGGLLRKRARLASDQEACEAEGGSAGEAIGRFFVIAVASYLLAGLPVMLLSSLQGQKALKRLDARGSPAWRRQLRVWATQQLLFWFFGLAYCGFCLFYVCLFLANLGDADDEDWSLAGLFALMQDFVIVPIAMSTVVPLMATSLVACHRAAGGSVRALQEHSGELLHRRHNIRLPAAPVFAVSV